MRGRWRAASPVLAAPILAGCMTLDAHLEIGVDETVRYQAVATITRDHLEAEGVAADDDVDLCQSLGHWFYGEVTMERLAAPDEIGCRIEGVAPIGEFGRSEIGRSGLIVLRADGLYTFIWNPMPGADVAAALSEFEVSVTFPGEVVEHNGSSTVWWNTVTWRDPADLFRPPGLVAKGNDKPSPLATVLPLVGLLALLILVLWSGRALLRRLRGGRAEPAAELSSDPDEPGVAGVGESVSAADPPAREPLAPDGWVPQPEDPAEPERSPWAPPE